MFACDMLTHVRLFLWNFHFGIFGLLLTDVIVSLWLMFMSTWQDTHTETFPVHATPGQRCRAVSTTISVVARWKRMGRVGESFSSRWLSMVGHNSDPQQVFCECLNMLEHWSPTTLRVMSRPILEVAKLVYLHIIYIIYCTYYIICM